jgi:hypothetical protein
MTDSLIFTIKAIKRLREAAIHTPTFIGCNRVSTNGCGFSELHILWFCASSKKKKLMSNNNLQAKLKNKTPISQTDAKISLII